MKIIDFNDYKIVILETNNEDPDLILQSYNEDNLIYVPLQGYHGSELSSDRFLVRNFKDSFENHLMWEGHFDAEDQEKYIAECCKKFWETGKQMLIENYEYQRDEPFYDYSK